MSFLIHSGYQRFKKCSNEQYLQLRGGIINRTEVMYPTMDLVVMENTTSDFEPVPHNEYEMLLQDQIQRRLVCEDTVASCAAAGDQVRNYKRKYAEQGTGPKKRMKEHNDLMKAVRMHHRKLTALVVTQEESIATFDVELADLKHQQHIEDSSARCVAEFQSTCTKTFTDLLENLFLAAVGVNAVTACNKLQLVAERIAMLVCTLIHVRAVGLSLSLDQVSEMYVALYPDAVKFSVNHPTYSHFLPFGMTDFEIFESQILKSSLVSVSGDNK